MIYAFLIGVRHNKQLDVMQETNPQPHLVTPMAVDTQRILNSLTNITLRFLFDEPIKRH